MENIGLYIHVPFCRRKCRYCDFYSRPPGEGEADRFAEAVVREMALTQESVRLCAQTHTGLGLGTVYFGGGTPSMLGVGRLAKILSAIRERWQIAPDPLCVCPDVQTNTSAGSPLPEITIEANPLDLTPEWAAGALEAGFNRVSIGVQSIGDDDLRFLGRLHHAGDGPHAAETARAAGFDEIGIDLIYGLPGQTRGVLRERVTRAVERCRPEHVSCYQLTYTAGTPLTDDVEAGRVRPLLRDDEYELFVTLHRVLDELGYPAYEVSNFARDDAFFAVGASRPEEHGQACPQRSRRDGRATHRSRHNSNYWRHVPYIGLGPSAHSFDGQARAWNVSSVTDYLALVENGELPVGGSEELSGEQLASEMVMLALRTTDGLDLNAYRQRFGRDFLEMNRAAVQGAVRRGLVTLSNSHLRPTVEGLAVADGLAAEFRYCNISAK